MAAKFKLTNEIVRSKCLPPQPGEVTKGGRPVIQKIYWDAELPGFGVLVGRHTKTFIAQADISGRSVRTKVGRWPKVTAELARKSAKELLGQMALGTNPNAKKREAAEKQRKAEWQTFTLDQAITEHTANLRAKGCAERTPVQMREELERLCGDWLHKPLVQVRRKDCIERHRKITTDNGPYVANRIMRAFRAVWNSARRMFEDLPAHPVIGVTFNKERRRREPVPWESLPDWWERVRGLPSPVRRDLNLAILFSGLRATDASTIRWDDVDFKAGTLHRPSPKGGEDKAFTVPLCDFLLRLLARRKRDNAKRYGNDHGWAFPTRNRAGHIVAVCEPKEQRLTYKGDGHWQKKFHLPSPHRLRDTFATACKEAGVDLFTTKILLNHSLPSETVTDGYIRPSTEHVRVAVEKVSAFLRTKKRGSGGRGEQTAAA